MHIISNSEIRLRITDFYCITSGISPIPVIYYTQSNQKFSSGSIVSIQKVIKELPVGANNSISFIHSYSGQPHSERRIKNNLWISS